MAATSEIIRNSVYIKLDTGDSLPSGAPVTVSVSLGSLKAETLDVDKTMNIVTALAPCFSYDIHKTQHMVTNELVFGD